MLCKRLTATLISVQIASLAMRGLCFAVCEGRVFLPDLLYRFAANYALPPFLNVRPVVDHVHTCDFSKLCKVRDMLCNITNQS